MVWRNSSHKQNPTRKWTLYNTQLVSEQFSCDHVSRTLVDNMYWVVKYSIRWSFNIEPIIILMQFCIRMTVSITYIYAMYS